MNGGGGDGNTVYYFHSYFSFSFFNKLFSSDASDSPSIFDTLFPCLKSTSSMVSFCISALNMDICLLALS